MKLAHIIKLSVFVNEDDSEELIIEKIKELFPADLEKEKLKIERKKATGLQENRIIILKLRLEKEKHTALFIENLVSKLNKEQKELLRRQAYSRLDDDLNFFIRLDKDKLMKENRYFITDSGNCFHIKMHIACFPAKREKAMEIIQKIFK